MGDKDEECALTPSKLKLFLIGLIAIPIISLYLVLLLPILIYRLIVCHLVAPFYRPDIGNIISGLGLAFALEFYPRKKIDHSAPHVFKSTIVVKLVLEGTVPSERLIQAFEERVLNEPHASGKGLMFPEFQQYPAPWMGFMFWKQDKNYNLNNHFHIHKIDDTGNELDSERYVEGMMEQLVNKNFPRDKSPWEVHIIHNYKNSTTSASKMTAMLICVHHSIADGFSIVNVLANAYLKNPSSEVKFVSPSLFGTHELRQSHPVWYAITSPFRVTVQILVDLGYLLWVRRLRVRTPWHVNPIEKVKHTLLRSKPCVIPMSMVKDVKNKVGVTFTAVLLSILSKGISESFKKAGGKRIKKFPMFVVLPLPNHPKELRNHATAAYVDVYPSPELDSQERLQMAESTLAEQKRSPFRPIISALLAKMFSFHLAPVTKLVMQNRAFATGLSNFPAPYGKFSFNGSELVDADFVAGTLSGVAGVAFTVFSYDGKIHIGATVESSIMSRDEVENLIRTIRDELFKLHQQSQTIDSRGG